MKGTGITRCTLMCVAALAQAACQPSRAGPACERPGAESVVEADTVFAVPRGAGILLGQVIDRESNRPLEFALVRIGPSTRVQRTDEKGRFTFNDVSSGQHAIRANHIGHYAVIETVHLEAGTSARLVLRMQRDTTSPFTCITTGTAIGKNRASSVADAEVTAESYETDLVGRQGVFGARTHRLPQ